MKKHLHNSLRALFLSLAVLLSLPMLAVEVMIGGINYDLNAETKQATVKAKSSGEYSGSIVIPESVTHESTAYSVTSIGGFAFEYCSDLTSVTIPNSVTSIGYYAFRNCSGLTSVTIPNSVTSIGEYVFYGCSGLSSVTIGNSVTSIGWAAFSDCSGLTSVTIPNSVASIGVEAFSGCSGLTSIVVEEGNTVYDSRNNCNAIIETASNTLHFGCKTTIIPNSVTSIGDKAFIDCSGLTSVTIPNSVTSIRYCAFFGCSGLTSVTIPNSVTSIGTAAFSDCSGLTSVTIGNGVESIGAEAFCDCPELHDVYCYAENVPFTESNAFDGSYPENPTLHVPAASIDSYTATAPWSGFENIVAITTEVNGINYDFNADTKEATVIEKSSGGYSGEVVIPESVEYGGTDYSVTSIGENAFDACSGLTSVSIGNNVTSIGDYAFAFCYGLSSVTIPNSVTSIGDKAFKDCSGLTSVTIPNSVESIGESAFFRCSGLTSVSIGNSVASIGEWAFCDCSGLTSIVVEEGNTVYDSRNNCNAIIETASNTLHLGCKTTVIPNSVTSIGSSAFYGCSDLTSVTIPNSVTSIRYYAFLGCSGLTSVTIPNSVTSIGNAAFYDCPELLDVYCYAENVPSTESNAFEDSPIKDATLHVPAASIDSYTETAPWDGFKNIVAITTEVNGINYDFNADTKEATVIEKSSGGYSGEVVIPESVEYGGTAYSVTSIGSSAFRDCSGLSSVTIGNSVESIGESAFFRCSGLTSVTIPNSVTSIGEWAFCGCSGLNSIVVEEGNTVYDSRNNCNAIIETASNTLHLGCKTTVIPNSVTSIGSSAFYECSDLTSVTIPNSVTSIGRYAFEHCDGLTSVTIPNSVTSIGNAAFYDCPELLDVYCYAENVPSTESNAFEYSPIADATLHVPAGSVDRYNETAPWDGFANIVALPNQYELTVSSAGYATLCLAFNAEIPQDVDVYVAEKVDGDCLKMKKVEGVLPAMTGVIVKANEGTYAFIQSEDTPAEIGENLLVGSVVNTMVRADENTSYYILAAPDENNNEVGMYRVELVGDKFECMANKAYLPIPSAHARIYFDFGTETGIGEVKTENGEQEAEIYDLSGRKVQNAQKGIFIVNGKKVIK